MKKIIAIIAPFQLKQDVYVYEDGNKVDIRYPKLEELEETIFSLSEQYDVEKVNLIGSKQFNRGLVKKIKEKELSKYQKNRLDITL
ncbi:MAG: hypothetical protein [Caudoviricetes sp.]|nr:MAG: hypothetical protein [Caudoviricetes sp.]